MFHRLSLDYLEPFLFENRPFVFLDTARPGAGNTQSFLFLDPLTTLRAETYDEVIPLINSIAKHAKRHWVAGYLSYEAAYGIDPAGRPPLQPLPFARRNTNAPLGWFGVFNKPCIFNHAAGAWDGPLPLPVRAAAGGQGRGKAAGIETAAAISRSDYTRAVNSIKRFIASGHTYQINFTYDVLFTSTLPTLAMYRRLRENQPAPYCSLLSDGESVIASFSPELFFRKNRRRMIVQPMKGTARRGRFLEEDIDIRDALARDEKNRSENIMIVDLMRSDLGKFCEVGSIAASRIYSVETLPTLHQMTSTISATAARTATLLSIFTSLFPSGSVTGAPKIRSMEIIRSLEKGNRGVYCGAIGYVSPRGKAVFSVPIRTLQSTRRKGRWKYRVGSGIVWNSKARDEWMECAVKCDFLTKETSDFELFESLLWDKRLLYKRDHVNRLKRSAQYFFFTFNRAGLIGLFTEIERTLGKQATRKVRVFLAKDGLLRWDSDPIDTAAPTLRPITRLSMEPVSERNPLLFHKTTHRPWYGADAKTIRKENLFDVIHVNSRSEITEGSRCNVFISRGDTLLTPPVTCGLLPGVLRENLLRRKKCREEILKPKDVLKAEVVYCGNSVRGLVRVNVAPY